MLGDELFLGFSYNPNIEWTEIDTIVQTTAIFAPAAARRYPCGYLSLANGLRWNDSVGDVGR